MPERLCQYCGQPLLVGCHARREYHPDCAKIVYDARHARYANESRQRLKHPRPKRDPMRRLGIDYVSMKLAGQIRMPKVERQFHLFKE